MQPLYLERSTDCAGGRVVLDHGGEPIIGMENVRDNGKNTHSIAAFKGLVQRRILVDFTGDGGAYILSALGQELAKTIK